MVKYRTRSVVDREVQNTIENVRDFMLNKAERIPEEVIYQSYSDVLRWIENQLGLQKFILDQKQYSSCVAEWLDEVLEWYNKKQMVQDKKIQTRRNSRKRTRSGRKIKVKTQQTRSGRRIKVNTQQNHNTDEDYNDDGDYFLSDEEDDDDDDKDDDNFQTPLTSKSGANSNKSYMTRSSKRLKLTNSKQSKKIQINIGSSKNQKKVKQILYGDNSKKNSSKNSSSLRNISLLDVPIIAFERIASKLDHDSLFLFLQTNKQVYNCLNENPVFWKSKCEQKGWEKLESKLKVGDTNTITGNSSNEKNWKEQYKQVYNQNCFNCFGKTDNFTFSFGKLCLRVCRECMRNTLITERKAHRLVTKTGSKFRYKVNDRELEQLSYALVPNMENALFNLTSLFRKVDVVKLGVQKWGSQIARDNKFIEPKL